MSPAGTMCSPGSAAFLFLAARRPIGPYVVRDAPGPPP